MPLFVRKSSIIPRKRKVEMMPEKEPNRAVKEPAKTAIVAATKEGDQDPINLVKGRVAEVDSSSLRPKIYKQLTLPAMLPEIQHFAKPQKTNFIERFEVEIHAVLRKRWT